MLTMQALAVGRLALAAAALAAPSRFARAVGIAPSPELGYLTRVYGVRALAMGTGYLTAGPDERRRWKRLGLMVDTADTITGFVHLARRDVPVRSAVSMVLLTGVYAVAEVLEIVREGMPEASVVVASDHDDSCIEGNDAPRTPQAG